MTDYDQKIRIKERLQKAFRDDMMRLFKERDLVRLKETLHKDNINCLFGIDGDSLLHMLCKAKYHNFEILNWMIGLGANVNARNRKDETPLHITALTGDYEKMEILIKAGAKTDCKDDDGLIPLQYCTMPDTSKECIQLLVRYNPVLNNSELNKEQVGRPEPILKWIEEAMAARHYARTAAIILIGLKRFNKSLILKSNNMDVIRMIARLIWKSRIDPIWQQIG